MNSSHRCARKEVKYCKATSSNVSERQLLQRNVMQLTELTNKLNKLEGTLGTAITPYEMHKVVNATLKTNLPPQMFYNYVKKQYIPSSTVKDGDKTKIIVKKDDVLDWIERYAIKHLVSVRAR